MDTKALRQKILDLAIRGKLVPQDPNDEPASVLLERIRAQKQQMVKDGILKEKDIKNDTVIFIGEDNLHYEKYIDGTVECIRDEVPFGLPEGWGWCRLNSIYELLSGRDLNPSEYNDNNIGIPYITGASNFKCNTVSIVRWTPTPKVITEIGDVLITCKGTVGDIAINDFGKAHIARQIMAIRNTYSLNADFLSLCIQYYVNELKNAAKGLIPGIARENILYLFLPIPPISEQQRIVSKLDKILSLIAIIENDKNALHNTISAAKSKILDLAVRGKLVPQDPADEPASALLERIRAEKEEMAKQGKIRRGSSESAIFKGGDNRHYEKYADGTVKCVEDEVPFELPEGWEWARLKSICGKIVDGSHNPPKGQDYKTDYIMASSRNINNDTLNDLHNVRYISKEEFEKENERTKITENDLLLTTVASLGRSCIYHNFPPNLCFQRSVTVITTLILQQYLKLYFDSPKFQSMINNEANGTAQKGFYLNQLENVIIPIPPLNEQKRISIVSNNLLLHLCAIEKSLD